MNPQPRAGGRAPLYVRYPVTSLFIYNGTTMLHFLLGGFGIIYGYRISPWAGWVFGCLYLAFAFAEMYLLMPLTVCPGCVYRRIPDARCISGLNLLSQRLTPPKPAACFARRGQGLLCANNRYMAALVIPALALIPAMTVNFSVVLLLVLLALLALLAYRFLIIFPKIACLHCRAKYACPQAGKMGVRER